MNRTGADFGWVATSPSPKNKTAGTASTVRPHISNALGQAHENGSAASHTAPAVRPRLRSVSANPGAIPFPGDDNVQPLRTPLAACPPANYMTRGNAVLNSVSSTATGTVRIEMEEGGVTHYIEISHFDSVEIRSLSQSARAFVESALASQHRHAQEVTNG